MPVVAPLALAVATVGTGYSIYSGQKAASAQKKAAVADQARNDLQAARQKRDAIRSARVAYGAVQQSAENQGVSQSSSAIGGQASVASQLNSNLSFLDNYQFQTDTMSQQLSKAATYRSNAQTGADVASLAFSAYNNSPRIAAVFKGK